MSYDHWKSTQLDDWSEDEQADHDDVPDLCPLCGEDEVVAGECLGCGADLCDHCGADEVHSNGRCLGCREYTVGCYISSPERRQKAAALGHYEYPQILFKGVGLRRAWEHLTIARQVGEESPFLCCYPDVEHDDDDGLLPAEREQLAAWSHQGREAMFHLCLQEQR